MSTQVLGVDEILKNIEAKLGESRTNRIVNKALRETGDEVVKIVEEAVSSYIDTGATHDNVVRSNVKKDPHKTVAIGWATGKRWRLVHLNEFGYVRHGKFVRPRGFGKLQSAVDKTKSIAVPKMTEYLKELGQ